MNDLATLGPRFGLSAAQEQLRERAHAFARDEIAPVASTHDAAGTFPWGVVQRAGEAGLRNFCVPRELGGLGLGTLDGCLIVEEIGWGCGGVANALTISEVAALPIVAAGAPEQQRTWLGALVSGGLATFALTEPEAGSDLGRLASTARRHGGDYVLRGKKTLISNPRESTWFLVFARTSEEPGSKALSAFVVPRDLPGVRVGRCFEKMGQRASDTGELLFEDVVVPATHRLGAEGQGASLILKAFEGARPWTAAAALGVGRRAFEEARTYACQREAFGQPIWKHQGIGHKLAEMAMTVHAARLLMWNAAWNVDIGHPDAKLLAYAKTFAADGVMRVCTEAVQVFGGYGYMREFPVEKLMRDAKAFQIYDGTSEIQRNVIARELCADPRTRPERSPAGPEDRAATRTEAAP